jgi:hypothetical protein
MLFLIPTVGKGAIFVIEEIATNRQAYFYACQLDYYDMLWIKFMHKKKKH